MNKEKGKLTPKQERFIQEYLVDLNATQSAIRAGYSIKTAAEQASRLLTNVRVSEAIAKGQQALAERIGVTAEKVIDEMALIGFSNMQHYLQLSDPERPMIDLTRLTKEQASVIAELTHETRGDTQRVKIKLHDKVKALVNLGKHLGLFSEKHLLNGLDVAEIKHVQHMEIVFVEPPKRINADQ